MPFCSSLLAESCTELKLQGNLVKDGSTFISAMEMQLQSRGLAVHPALLRKGCALTEVCAGRGWVAQLLLVTSAPLVAAPAFWSGSPPPFLSLSVPVSGTAWFSHGTYCLSFL